MNAKTSVLCFPILLGATRSQKEQLQYQKLKNNLGRIFHEDAVGVVHHAARHELHAILRTIRPERARSFFRAGNAKPSFFNKRSSRSARPGCCDPGRHGLYLPTRKHHADHQPDTEWPLVALRPRKRDRLRHHPTPPACCHLSSPPPPFPTVSR